MTHRTSVTKARGRRAAYRISLGLGLLLCFSAIARAETTLPAKSNQTWRCTSGTGVVSYSQQPCEGRAELMQTADSRSNSQLRQSRDNNLRDAKLARQMQRERRHAERMASLERPVSLSKNRPHVIKATTNDHRPKPVSDSTRTIKIRSDKKQTGSAALSDPGTSLRR